VLGKEEGGRVGGASGGEEMSGLSSRPRGDGTSTVSFGVAFKRRR
jgi:hypothetical protein